MTYKTQKNYTAIFVDCFSTIIYRNIRRKEVFKQWAIELSEKYNIPWKIIYKKYNQTNFNLSFKKLLTTITLQEHFDTVLKNLFNKLAKKYNNLELNDFIKTATTTYYNKELACFTVNQKLIDFLLSEKNAGKKIYLVSDFYCKSDVLLQWFTSLKINHIFDKLFSSADFSKEKATTKLYKELLKQLELNPKNVIMYGDNVWSDILIAKICGLNAKRVTRNTKENYEKK